MRRAEQQNTEIGMYNDCAMAPEPTRAEMLHAIETFLEARQPSETALLYFSGHGEYCEQDGQLYFLTRDTDPADLPGTAVPAEFLERMLQSCRAASKLVLLDCCSSGSVVQGWTAKGPEGDPDRPAPSTLLRPTGVYFITASDALQTASAMAPPGSRLGTSRFTGEIVEGLRNGRIKEGGWITPDDLFHYLTTQMVRLGVPEEQRPTKSTIRATRTLPFARSVARPVHIPALPDDTTDAGRRSSTLLKARKAAEADERDGVDPQRLLRYYADCLTAQSAAGMRPDRDSGRDSKYFLLTQGEEIIQSGCGPHIVAPGSLSRPQNKRSRAGTEAGNKQEYWYGYPALTLPARNGGRGRRATVDVAPLLIQQMDLAPDENGRDVLRPSGVPSLHSGVVSELLDADDAAELMAHWQPAWQEGNTAQMLLSVRELLNKLGMAELEPLDPSALSGDSVMQALRPGAHNAAVLLVPSGAESMATQALVDNLLQISSRTDQIAGTALEALLNGGGPQAPSAAGADPVMPVTPGPCNESQERVISSAMTQPLTVATGPPGTGKSKVVTAVVTTCVAAGQSVLVASTNNEAVDVVAQRCDEIAPGLLMRTGNAEALEREAAKVERLLAEPPGAPPRGSATVRGELRNTRKAADLLRAEATDRVVEERRLLELLRDREERAAGLGLPLSFLERVWAADADGPARMSRWTEKARRAARARWWQLGAWRRGRALAALLAAGAGPSDEGAAGASPPWEERPAAPKLLESLAGAVSVEREVRELVRKHGEWDEGGLKESRVATAEAVSDLSAELSRALSAETLARATALMNQRLQALRRRSGFQRSQKNLMAHIKGWAVSTHSVRQLELTPKLFDLVVIDEASQCSIPSVLPLLFRARRALIIGDPMQLGHIPGVPPQQERQARVRAGLSAAQLEHRRLTYHLYSSYQAAEQHGDSALLLDEHYRCHPRIADVVNGHCYGGRLRVLTDVRQQVPAYDPTGAADPAPVLGWVDVPSGESARGSGGRSWRNTVEAETVRRVVDGLLAGLPPDAKVGVVTPFRAQKDALAQLWRDDSRVRVGTVHTFQGGERDVMVLSPVASRNTPPGTTHWVASQVNLWNVAVTRAKSQLITVGTRAFWQEQSGVPALLAARWAPLGAGDDGTTGERGAPGPVAEAREELADRLQQYLSERGITDLERAALVGGHRVDLLFTDAGENTAVLIDPGPGPGEEPARHLRLAHAQGDLLTGLPSGGHGAKPCPVNRTVRVPAWRIMRGGSALAPLFD